MPEKNLASEINERGYAVVSAPTNNHDPFAVHAATARTLGLSDAYLPLLYRDKEVRAAVGQVEPYNEIPRNTATVEPWSETPGQSYHVDGLLEPLGGIKTTILHCLVQAHSGGETELLDSCAAFADLQEIDEPSAQALLDEAALTRFATIPGASPQHLQTTGPVFGQVDGEFVTRFSDGPTERWNTGQVRHLDTALQHFRGPGLDTHRVRIRLSPGDMLIFRNDRLSHRGCPYQNGAEPRRLTRSMYSERPRQ
ncbi:TauD/TfdA family dioxygenase [Streptomyces sp. NPDC088768]|uniref:TauD/TfdA family dioxygenase n=1 Tax=Streptomyces sp. NPDC088768 TaxID=3365894 RepID=UPI0038062156